MQIELNIDGLVGPTHHFGGLGVGNIASIEHKQQSSNPRKAAMEGLSKAWLLSDLGVPQFLLPPPIRPRLDLLGQLGFRGSPYEQLREARDTAPQILSAVYSSAFMWAANSATISPACDTRDGKLYVTPANLISSWHRASEAAERGPQLHCILEPADAVVHPPLPAILPLRDEGAANHIRLCDATLASGFHIFVFGASEDSNTSDYSTRFLPRQTRAASAAIARRHQLDVDRVFMLQQHPDAISAGVFHNDVIATGHEHLLLHHAFAFLNSTIELERLEKTFYQATGHKLIRIEISNDTLPLADAVRSYFFNSQIIRPSKADGFIMLCPHQCQEIASARQLVEKLVGDSQVPIQEVRYVQLEQSMSGGGGPACLRLRVTVPESKLSKLTCWRLNAQLHDRWAAAIEKWYPESLTLNQLADSDFFDHIAGAYQAIQRL